MINLKFMGGILLIAGTSIGGGMLALPVSMAEVGMTNSVIFLLFCWLVMTGGALLILEVNLRLPPGSNMVTMAKSTLGLPGQIIAWVTCLCLLYTLLSAYISSGSDLLSSLLHQIHIDLPIWAASILFTSLFGLVIYNGINTVDFVNRGLMFGKLGVYLLLVLIISPHVDTANLHKGYLPAITGSLMILVTSFGFASIVPSLRDYFADDTRSLRRVILIGSLIPLVCYILWMVVIMGSVAREGGDGLMSLMHSDSATTGLIKALSHAVDNPFISGFFAFFTAICILTAFIGVALSLFDFLSDGLRLKKRGRQGMVVLALTLLPPLSVVLFNPGIYLHAFNYAGICCVLLLLLLPILMAWKGRKIDTLTKHLIILPGGQASLALVGGIALLLLGVAIRY